MDHHQLYATYSIAARDPETGTLGVAVQTHQIGVGRMVPFLLPGVGAVATQSLVNVSFGPLGLQFLRAGYAAERALAALVASDAEAARRQVAVVDSQGHAAAHTGSGCIPNANHHTGAGYSVQANMMTRDTVIPAMAAAFEKASGDLAARMLAALQAAQVEDGDIRGMQSAALKVVSGDPTAPAWSAIYDLRVDEHAEPLVELGRLVRLRHAQLVDTQGHQALDAGDAGEALRLWAEARSEAPELEELAFWEALALADQQGDVAGAVAILGPVLAVHPRRAHWIDLITRLGVCGFVDHPAAGDMLRAFWQDPADPANADLLRAHAIDYVIVPQIVGNPDSFATAWRWNQPFAWSFEMQSSPADAPYLEPVFEADGAQVYQVISAP